MNNCIVQGKILSIGKVRFSYYENLKASLVVKVAINCDVDNIMLCKIYDSDIDIFLDKYNLGDICIFFGSLINSGNNLIRGKCCLSVLEVY